MSKGKELRPTVLGSEDLPAASQLEEGEGARRQEEAWNLPRLEVGLILTLVEPLKDSELWAMTQMALISEKPLWCSV